MKEAVDTFGKPDIVNTDQGSQFTSESFLGPLKTLGVAISMDSKGRALDNIIIERFWRSLKYEEVYLKGYKDKSMRQAFEGIRAYFDFYNTKRPHQSLNYGMPCHIYSGKLIDAKYKPS